MALDAHLKIKGIDGESTQKGYEKQLQILSYSFDVSNSGSMAIGGGGGSGKSNFGDFHFTQYMGTSSPLLFQHCATGEHIAEATLTVRKAGQKEQQVFLVVKFSDFLVSHYSVGGTSDANDLPIDNIAFNYSKIEWEYKAQDEKGKTGGPKKAAYDVKKAIAH